MTDHHNQRLMSLHIMEDLTSCILDFQANIIRVTYRKKTTLVDPDGEPSHAAALQYIWSTSKLTEDSDENRSPEKWRMLGFGSEDIVEEFGGVGVLGLDCFVSAAMSHALSQTCHFNVMQRRFVESDADFSKVCLQLPLHVLLADEPTTVGP